MDQTVLSNRTVLDLRTRLATTTDAVQKNIIRLNLAVALARTGDWTNARAELKQVQLPDGTGVSLGTIRYLDALAEEAMGGRAAAETMLRALATSESLLTEDGPPIRELVEMRFAPPPPPPAAKPPK
jgi:hypothetical protein